MYQNHKGTANFSLSADRGHTVWCPALGLYNGGFGPIVPVDEVFSFRDSVAVFRDAEGIVRKMPVKVASRDNFARRQNLVRRLYEASMIGGYTDGDRVIGHVRHGAQGGLLDYHRSLGFVFMQGDALQKRLKALFTMYLVSGRADWLTYRILTEGVPRLQDGAMTIRQGAVERLIKERFLTASDDYHRDFRQEDRALKAKIWSVRIFVNDGLIKGHALVVDDAVQDVDILVHVSNVKPEIRSTRGIYFGMNPHFAKVGCRTNVQYLYNQPTLFPIGEMQAWIDRYIDKGLKRILGNRPLESVREMLLGSMEQDNADGSIKFQERVAAHAFALAGCDLFMSPTLLQGSIDSWVNNLSDGQDRVNVPIPGARYAQVFSETMIRQAGFNPWIKDGEIRYIAALHSYVVSDATWLRMIAVHGGCDMDDYFAVIHREDLDSRKFAVIMRTPQYIGEYSILTLADQTDLPRSSWGHEWIRFDPATMPVNILDSKGTCGKLEKLERPSVPMNRKWFVDEVRQGWFTKMSPGLYVNTLLALTYGWKRAANHLDLSMEDAIDAPTKHRDGRARAIFERAYQEVVIALAETGRLLDRVFQEKRFAGPIMIDDMAYHIKTEDGVLTQMRDYIKLRTDEMRRKIAEVQETRHDMGMCVPPMFRDEQSESAEERGFLAFKKYAGNVTDHVRNGTFGEYKKVIAGYFAGHREEFKVFVRILLSKRTSVGGIYKDGVLIYGPVWDLYREMLNV